MGKEYKTNPSVETRGWLDTLRIKNNALHIKGWVAPINSGAVESFKVFCAGKEITEFKQVLGISSPDVKDAFPKLNGAENARFYIRVPLNKEEQEQVRDSLIILTPLLKAGEGRALLQILEPSLPIPSEENINIVGGFFTEVCNEFLGHLVRAGLQRTDKVLDVGCGTGRIAYALTYYLGSTACYEGFDIIEKLIEWAQQTITPRFPNFNFARVDIYNKQYNPSGTIQGKDFVFPYDDKSFDFVFLTSVFTHLQAREVRHYLDEIYRVLKAGGRCLCTWFLLQEESERAIAAGKSSQELVYELDECFTTNPEVPEYSIGYQEPLLLKWMAERGLSVVSKEYGSWSGRSEFTSYQDIIVLQKD